jgi:hypothetical protein
MKEVIILLDENVPKKLKYRFGENYTVNTTVEKGWASKTNGALMELLNESNCQYFITCDKGIAYQQNLDKINFTLIILVAASNDYEILLPLILLTIQAIEKSTPDTKLIRIDGKP